ncbi:MAG: DUF4416 family protein [Nanoarchaeota archaeon]|nr:DUF4416 family protein [Nanoarchaeota archaeon]MBU1004793.1 DUF4416 family protein [Nanoarchaeota archaeon]MBU1946489.1 DUF4416 family protein [Nanoarchaeota archaeon]
MLNAKLIIAIMYSDKEIYSRCKKDLIDEYGEIAKESYEYDFDKFTSFYAKEMGTGLVKRFLVFVKDIKDKKEISEIKHKITEIEKKYSDCGNRTINLDPGYLSSEELVLASFKRGTNYKEQISEKVWLHKVLEFDGKEVKMFWHTFPDYRDEKNWEFFVK